MMSREDAYKLIDGERDYQIQKWSPIFDDDDWTPNDWIIFIERYVQEAKDNTGTFADQMASIRKIAGLAVAAMQHLPTPARM